MKKIKTLKYLLGIGALSGLAIVPTSIAIVSCGGSSSDEIVLSDTIEESNINNLKQALLGITIDNYKEYFDGADYSPNELNAGRMSVEKLSNIMRVKPSLLKSITFAKSANEPENGMLNVDININLSENTLFNNKNVISLTDIPTGMFDPNSTFLFILAGLVIVFVIAQSVFFLVRAYRRGKTLGMDMKQIRKTIISTAVFTFAPAVSILLGVITLSKFLGLPLPWLRLSVIGAITYELPAATTTANALGITALSETITNPEVYTAIAWVMTLGIFPGLIWVPLFIKKIQGGLMKIKNKDSKWGDILMTALFLGMISAFLGMVFADIRSGLAGWIPIFVLLFSAFVMGICGILVKVCRMKWLENYALPVSMLCAMAFAVVITPMIV